MSSLTRGILNLSIVRQVEDTSSRPANSRVSGFPIYFRQNPENSSSLVPEPRLHRSLRLLPNRVRLFKFRLAPGGQADDFAALVLAAGQLHIAQALEHFQISAERTAVEIDDPGQLTDGRLPGLRYSAQQAKHRDLQA